MRKVCKICKICNISFEVKRNTRLYCSRKCNSRSQYLSNKNIILDRNRKYRVKNRESLNKNLRNYYKNTKNIQNARRKKRYQENKQLETENRRERYKNNPEKYKKINKKWIENNKESRREYTRFFTSQRRAKKLNATLDGYDQEIREIYKKCPKRYHVDHIVPLINKNISGLHVPWNLQYLTPEDNLRKSNKFDKTVENSSWKLGDI